MTDREVPKLDTRRADDFRAELTERARAWMRDWNIGEANDGFGAALLDVVARFSAQVAERLDRAGEKLSLGLLDWLALRGQAARPARMPVSFRLADNATNPVLAQHPVRLQVDVDGASVVFETESDVRLVPGKLELLVGIDAAQDSYYLPPPGLTSLDPLEPRPGRWTLKNFVTAGDTRLQLSPGLGLAPGAVIEMDGNQYLVDEVEGDLVTIEPGLLAPGGLSVNSVVTRVDAFDAFGGAAHNWQRHAIYLGDEDALNIDAPANIEIVGASALTDATFEYWGKTGSAEPGWHEMPLAAAADQRAGSVVLAKPAGSIEPKKIGSGAATRWIRARQNTITGGSAVLNVEQLRLVINRGGSDGKCPEPGVASRPSPEAEGFTNSTPLAFTSLFYPMGREPRQFDTFFIGCTEAFSKKDAKVSICFELADPSVNSFGVLRSGGYANRMVAGIGQDRALHLYSVDSSLGGLTRFFDRGPLRPPKPRANVIAADGEPIALAPKPTWRPPLWSINPGLLFSTSVFIAVAARENVWAWKEKVFSPQFSGWIAFGPVRANPPAGVELSGLVYLDAPGSLFALLDGAVYKHSADESSLAVAWTPVTLLESGAALVGKLRSLSPVYSKAAAGFWTGRVADGMVGVVQNGANTSVYTISATGACTRVPNSAGASASSVPVAGKVGLAGGASALRVFWHVSDSPARIAAVQVKSDGTATPATASLPAPATGALAHANINGQSLELVPATLTGAATNVTLVASASDGARSWLLSWTPFDGSAVPSYSETELPEDVGPFGGAPAVLDTFVVVPGTNADAWVSRWHPELRIHDSVPLNIGLVTDDASLLGPNDSVLFDHGTTSPTFDVGTVAASVASLNGKFLFPLSPQTGIPRFASGVSDPRLIAMRGVATGTGLMGSRKSDTQLNLAPGDNITATGDWLTVMNGTTRTFCRVARGVGGDPDVARLTPNPHLPGGVNASVEYWRGVPLAARVAPYFSLSGAISAKLTTADLKVAAFTFKALTPIQQFGDAYAVSAGDHPTLVVLTQNWTTAPATVIATDFLLDATTAGWERQLSETTSNPELIWEYWNGTSWAKLENEDETSNLKSTGRLRFRVPNELAPTEVSGRTNHWIRARLIGGDYGREKVTVVTVTKPDGSTEQTVNRDASNFHPPLVVAMRIRYSLEEAFYPATLLTEDSGSLRDQSEANKTRGAVVEAFVPLALLVGRLAGGGGAGAAASELPASGCDCATPSPAAPGAPGGPNSVKASTAADAAASGTSLLLGLSADLLGEPINVLLLVEERQHDEFSPLTVSALVNDRFEPVTVRDTTRALGESGLLSMSFPVKPSPRDLFGRSLTWLLLRPSRTSAGAVWRPVIRGAYLNATWATAAETLTREPLGSSDGRPHLTVQVARPPLLQDSLELRVREPLDDEERRQLVDENAANVKSNEPDLKGDWVLWKQVPDPDDAGPRERVYSLDEQSGEIEFGDGIHGMVPPIGRDAVVAFSYRRTEPAAGGSQSVPANAVTARTALQLVTPVESVEAAFAADGAAGGSPPESDGRVLRFGNARLRHRGRAIAASDFEDLALQSSPDIAQARAFHSAQGIRLVVVMRGPQPAPTAAQRRDLQRLLQSAASPLLGHDDAVTISGPKVRRLRLRLALRVASLDDAGRLGEEVKLSLTRLFDSATGGVSGSGWPLGAPPSDDDIALALYGAENLAGIDTIELVEIDAKGNELPWRAQLRADELIVLADDALRTRFEPLELAV